MIEHQKMLLVSAMINWKYNKQMKVGSFYHHSKICPKKKKQNNKHKNIVYKKPYQENNLRKELKSIRFKKKIFLQITQKKKDIH